MAEAKARGRPDGLVPRLNRTELDALVTKLLITSDDIQTALDAGRAQNSISLEGRLVVLHSGWYDRFADVSRGANGEMLSPQRFGHKLDHPGWVACHPYLTHPYLDFETARWLVDEQGVQGVAVDWPTPECFLYYIDAIPLGRAYIDAQAKFLREHARPDAFVEPVHAKLLNSRRLLAESLRIREGIVNANGVGIESRLEANSERGSRVLRDIYQVEKRRVGAACGRLWSFPLDIRRLPDACLTKLMFEPEQ
jgi:kynurenine formamidase